MGVLHGQWLEDTFRTEISEWFTAHALDDEGHERVACIAVEILRPWLEVQLLLLTHQFEHVFGLDDVIHAPAGSDQQLPLVAQAADVVDEVTYRYGFTEVG